MDVWGPGARKQLQRLQPTEVTVMWMLIACVVQLPKAPSLSHGGGGQHSQILWYVLEVSKQ